MPVNSCSDGDKPGFKWGDSGKCYTYNPSDAKSKGQAKKRAYLQGIAIGEYAIKENLLDDSISYFIEDYSIQFGKAEEMINGCPSATQDIRINLKNRAAAIQIANYGPLNPDLPNEEFWQQKAELFNSSIEEAKTALCKNCAVFIQKKETVDCIAQGLGGEDMAYEVIEAANLGYCDIFEFKCAGNRTCDAWVTGGPITD